MNESPLPSGPRWLHLWAILTVAVTLPLLLLGAEVTTKGVGMVDARGLRSPWFFFQEFADNQGLDWRIEHGHRQAGWIVGLCTILFAIGLWWKEPRRSVKWVGLLTLLGVCLQGTLGIFRIEFNALFGKNLATIHGVFAQVIFALMISLALVTSLAWQKPTGTASPNLRAWSLFTGGLVFMQLILGGLVRHQDFALAGRSHLLFAFAVVASSLWLAKLAFEQEVAPRAIKVLLGLVALQVFLGVEAWLSKFFVATAGINMLEPLALHGEWFRTLHYLTGAMIFATTVVIALRAQQALARQPAAARVLEGPA